MHRSSIAPGWSTALSCLRPSAGDACRIAERSLAGLCKSDGLLSTRWTPHSSCQSRAPAIAVTCAGGSVTAKVGHGGEELEEKLGRWTRITFDGWASWTLCVPLPLLAEPKKTDAVVQSRRGDGKC
eukprot:3513338-Pyramimonas_sp.AAC.1